MQAAAGSQQAAGEIKRGRKAIVGWKHLSSSDAKLPDCSGRKYAEAATPLPSGDMSPESLRSSSAPRLDSRRRSVASSPARCKTMSSGGCNQERSSPTSFYSDSEAL